LPPPRRAFNLNAHWAKTREINSTEEIIFCKLLLCSERQFTIRHSVIGCCNHDFLIADAD
jgi:hypothetical protein